MIFEKLSEEESYLLAILMDESGIDLAEFCYIDETQEDGCFRAWPFQVPWFRNKNQKHIDAACFVSDTKILTSTGWKNISEIKVGEYVLTHRNRWRKVLETHNNGERDVVNFRPYGNAIPLRVTSSHKLFARHARRGSIVKDGHKRKKLLEEQWVAIEDWKWNDRSQIITTHHSSPGQRITPFFDLQLFEVRDIPNKKNNSIETVFCEDWMFLYGLWMAEGSVNISDVHGHAQIQWSLHRDEISDITPFLDRLNLNYCISYSKTDKSAKLLVNSRPLGQWLSDHAGRGCHNKFVASWVYQLPDNLRQAVLDGAMYGDGSVKNKGFEYSTTSYDLVLGLRMLANTLGMSCSAWQSQPLEYAEIRGKQIFPGISYGLNIIDLDIQKGSRGLIEDGYFWAAPTIQDTSSTTKETVYDLTVEEDNSFCAEGIYVHNSRSCGKSMSIKLRAFAFPFNYPGEEMLVTAPEAIHLQAVTDNIENLYNRNKLAREMLAGQIKHRPYHMNFTTGSRLMGRIPQRDGSGVQGMHPLILEHDEAANYPEPGWTEIQETVKIQNPRARWRAHGVSFGIGGTFNEKISGRDSSWAVTKLPAMYRPNWTEEERQDKIAEYHGSDSSGFRRNIYGFPADAGSPMFVYHRLMAARDEDEFSEYNTEVYYHAVIDEAEVRDNDGEILDIVSIPYNHTTKYNKFWIGMDLGWAQSPSSIIVFAEDKDTKKQTKSLRMITRLLLKKITPEDQVKVILHFLEVYQPMAFALDATGAGHVLYDNIMVKVRENPDLRKLADRIKDINFSSKVIVGFNDSIKFNEFDPDGYLDAAIKRPFIEAATDAIRVLIDNGNLILPNDGNLIDELQALPSSDSVTEAAKINMDAYGKPGRKKGMHNLDAMRLAVLCFQNQTIDEIIAKYNDVWRAPSMILL